MRRSLLSKLTATWFVALIVLPFTAPFQAYDAGAPVAKTSGHDLKTSDKLSKDAATAASVPAALFPLTVADGISVWRVSLGLRRHHLPPTVLRL